MDNKQILQMTTDIVVAMINKDYIPARSIDETNENIAKTIECVYKKLDELNKNTVIYS